MTKLFGRTKSVFAMLHIRALPGTPLNRLTMDEITAKAVEEAQVYLAEGVDGLIIENMHDVPYLNGHCGPEIVAGMTAVAVTLRKLTDKPIGIQILAGCNKEALAVAHIAGLDFIRAEGFVFGHVADEGIMNSCAGELLRYRKSIGAEKVLIFTDIMKKHSSHAITADLDVADHAEAAEFFLSDGLIITGSSTAKPASIEELEIVQKVSKLPILIGSGLNAENIERYYPFASGFIVGSNLKIDGKWQNELSQIRIRSFMESFRSLYR
ncbi:MAG: BtpA/SgcQ family protein [Candidatus Cloacimonetes bacterium]|nr:BtpA/SgcQ family protein [Candidatus Cloacimonadota bacterium]